jgi:uncharacterized protein (TIGR03083 family)
VPDDAELEGLDPADLLDREAARLDDYFSELPASHWHRPSRCPGWSIRDVLAHLAAAEAYHHACLAGRVQDFAHDVEDRGGTDLTSANDLGIAELADRTPGQLLEQWRADNAETRRGFRARGDGRVDTSVGDYPSRWQAFHVAGELAVHADDVFVSVPVEERASRRDWRARFSRFALAECKPELVVRVEGSQTRVHDGGDVLLDDDELIEGVAGRLDAASRLTPADRALLNTMP